MKWFVFATLFGLVLIGLLAFLTRPKDQTPPFAMHGIMKNHAVLHTSAEEVFAFEIIMNDTASYYSYEEPMVSHALLASDDDFKAPLHLEAFERERLDGDRLKLTLHYALPYESESDHTALDPATLEIVYDDGMEAEVPIGTFSYRFPEASSESALDYEKITVLSAMGEEGSTAGGVCIELANKGKKPLVIEGIDPLNQGLSGNMDYLEPCEKPPTPFTSLDTLFGASFNPKAPSLAKKTATLKPDQTTAYCVPFQRLNGFKTDTIPLAVDYTVDETPKTLYIDEFMYIRENGNDYVDMKEEARATLETDPKD
ncbi:MAG: hypothetical protein ACOC2X_00820 [Bacillota bacterium]